MNTLFRLPLPVRVVVIAVAWFSYAILVLDLNSLDSGSRSANLIWTACLVGAALTVVVDPGLRPKFGSIEQLIAYHWALLPGDRYIENLRSHSERLRHQNANLTEQLSEVLIVYC